MRLKRLDLNRYGNFTDQHIDFGEHKKGEPDLHIVYGPNEAGKSTALAAFLDLLFGIEARSRFNFLHPYPAMRIGASLELAAGTQELLRVKRPQNSLLDAGEQTISDGIILGELGGIDRDSYRTMFSLDDETLEAGGESILASQGDLGQLLFSASAGLADLSRRLVDLRAEADGFYKYRARGGKLSDLKGQLGVLKEKREQIDTAASQYAQLVEIRDRTGSQYEEAITRRGQIHSRIEEIQRLLNALPRLAALRSIRERLLPLAGLPEKPLGWVEELPKLQKDEIEIATRLQALEDEISQLSSTLDTIVVDEAAMMLAEKVERLADLRARHVTAEKDIPERRLQLRETELVISRILSRVEREGETNPARLVLGASVVGVLRELIETRSGVEAAVQSAENELSAARHRLDEAEAKLKEAGGKPKAGQGRDAQASSLLATVAALRADDHAARHRIAARSRVAQLETLGDRIRDLRPWQGDVEHLVELAVPESGDIERWKKAASDGQKQIDRQAGEVERLTTECLRLKAELDAIGISAGVVSDHEASGVRSAREQAWASHRRTLDVRSADAFEAVLRHDDIVTSARFGHAADLAKLHQTSQALAMAEADLSRAQQLRDASEKALQRVREEIAGILRAMTPPLPDDMPLTQLDVWLTRRVKALEVRASVLTAERDLSEAEADAKNARERLMAALIAASVPFDTDAHFETLLAAAQAAIERETELKALRDTVDDRQRDLKNRERDAEKATTADQTWTALWAKGCSASWLGETGSALPLGTVREILAAIADLGPALEKQASLADRIAKMEKDQTDFAAEVSVIANKLNIPTTSIAILDLTQAINDRVHNAKAEQTSRTAKEQSLKIAQGKKRALAETLAIHTKRKAEMTTFFSVGSLADVGVKLQGAEKKAELQEQADLAARDILNALGLQTMDEGECVLDGADRTALEAELAELKARFDDQDRRGRDLFSDHSKAIDQVKNVGGDDAVAKIEEQRQTTLLEIKERALQYLRRQVGTAAAEQALRAYRDQHRSSMMARASEAFRTISRGVYKGLATQPEKESEVLIAIGADGGSKVASELSRGTRFQLYLALRVAGYHEFALSRRPVPFIADDIMETFDDFRAEEAFRVFSDMAGVGQVIYLTHHQHLCEIARRICPSVRIHSLGS
jgi:uncharacterized protein YhaN